MTWMGTKWGGFPAGGSVPSQCKGPGGGREPGQSGKVSDGSGSWQEGWRHCTGVSAESTATICDLMAARLMFSIL